MIGGTIVQAFGDIATQIAQYVKVLNRSMKSSNISVKIQSLFLMVRTQSWLRFNPCARVGNW